MATLTLLDDRYELGDPLGSGASGTVRRARDRVLGRDVAIKLLHPTVASDDVQRARLHEEARLAASLDHPGTARVYDVGEAPGDAVPQPYLVLELVEGEPLSRLIAAQRVLPPEVVLDLVRQVAEALAAAHAAGIVHRDLKPGNVLVTPEGRAVLVDFGIARGAGAEPLTATGTIVGTVDYLSPEQAEGRSATPRSDLYSLGMVAYEALTGQRPFRRDNVVATALAHLRDEAPPLPVSVPAPLRDLVERLISKDPDDRPADAAEVAALAGGAQGRGAAEAAPTSVVRLPAPLPERRGAAEADRFGTRRLLGGLAALTTSAALVVSGLVLNGSSGDPLAAPDVVGDRVGAALTELDGLGLEVREVAVHGRDEPAGTVLAQRPAAGEPLAEGDAVVLRISSGLVAVPVGALEGASWTRAAARLEALGLEAERVDVPGAGVPGDVVDVPGRGLVPDGAAVVLAVAVPALGTTSTVTSAAPAPSGGGSSGGGGSAGGAGGSGGSAKDGGPPPWAGGGKSKGKGKGR